MLQELTSGEPAIYCYGLQPLKLDTLVEANKPCNFISMRVYMLHTH